MTTDSPPLLLLGVPVAAVLDAAAADDSATNASEKDMVP